VVAAMPPSNKSRSIILNRLDLVGLPTQLARAQKRLQGSWMSDTCDKPGLTVRIIVKLLPDEYDQLFHTFVALARP
jgi:hypothetical protein